MTVTTLNHLKNPEELLESAFEAGEPLYVFDGAKTVLVVATPDVYNDMRELPRLIEVGASCFNHYCVGYDGS